MPFITWACEAKDIPSKINMYNVNRKSKFYIVKLINIM